MTEIEQRFPGNPPKWKDPDRLDRIIDAIEKGNFIKTAAEAAGVSYGSLRQWLRAAAEDEDPPAELVHFAERYEAARAAAEVKAVAHLWSVSGGGHLIKRRVFYDKAGNEVVEEEYTPPNAQPIQFLLERGFAHNWGRRQTLAIDTAGGEQDPAQGQADNSRISLLSEQIAQHLARQSEGEITDAEIVSET